MNLDLADWQRDYGATVDIYAPVSGTVMTQIGTAVPVVLVPYSDAGAVVAAPPSMAGGREQYFGLDDGTATVGLGCEWRYSGGTFVIQSVANWRPNRVMLLSKVATTYRP